MPHRLPMGRAERRAFLAQVPGADIGDVPAIIAQALALQMAVFLPLRAVGGELLRFLEPRVIVGLEFKGAAGERSKGLGDRVYTHPSAPGPARPLSSCCRHTASADGQLGTAQPRVAHHGQGGAPPHWTT